MLRRCSFLLWCMLLLHNFAFAGTSGVLTINVSSGSSLVIPTALTIPDGSTVTIPPGAQASGVLNVSSGNVSTADGTVASAATGTWVLCPGVSGGCSTSVTSYNGTLTIGSPSKIFTYLCLDNGANVEFGTDGGNVPPGITPGKTLSCSGKLPGFGINPGICTRACLFCPTRSGICPMRSFTCASAPITINLTGPASLQDNTMLNHGCVIYDLNDYSLDLGVQNATPLGGATTFMNAGDLEFSSRITITGEWVFQGNAYLSGAGNILDLSFGGTIEVRPHTTLNLSSLKIRNLGHGAIILDDSTSQLVTSFVEIEMGSNYAFTSGGIYADGPTNIVTKNNILDFSNQASLTVDGIALTYDTTTFTDQQNIRPVVPNSTTTSKYITKLNNGVIRQLNSIDYISQTSNAVVNLANIIRTDSNAFAFGIKNVSNALLYSNRTTSNAILKLNVTERTNSNAFAFGIKNNSNALLFGDRTNSNAIIKLNVTERTNSNAFAFGIKNVSNALLYTNRTYSNAILYANRTTSNALLYCCRTSSNATANLSTTLRVDSNAFAFGIKNVSNALLYSNRTTSNAILKLNVTERTNSNAFAFGIKNVSNALLYTNRTYSNAILYANRTTSNALLYCCRTSSNATANLSTTLRVDSNAFAYGIKNNSNAILNITSINQMVTNNSNAIIKLDRTERTNSNAFAFGIKNVSNALLYCCRTSSNAIVNLTNILRVDSNAFAFGIKNNSNAIVDITNEIVVIDQRITNNSNAIIKLDRTERTNSNAFAFGIKNLSNALLYCCRTSSNAIVNLSNIVRADSNAFAFGIKNNSNAILFANRTTSNAILYANRTTSNAILYLSRTTSNAILYANRTTSNAILWLNTQLQTIDHGPLPVDITQTTTSLSFDLYLSSEHQMFVTVNSTLDGHGHYIHFSNDRSDILNIAPNTTLVLKNVVLKGFSQQALGLGSNSNIIFGDGTVIELFADPDLSMTWTFEGQTTLSGQGEQLNLEAPLGNIFVSGAGSALLFDNIIVSGVSGNNIRCTDNHSTLSFYNTTWILDGNYTLTKGRFEVLSTFDLVGSYTFGYGTLASSIIQPNATLLLDIGSTFSYTPLSNNRDLLSMFDASSRLYMNGATLASTTTGLRLTNGTLIIDKRNYLHNDHAVALSQGISFGNGSSVNDLSVIIIPGANIDLVSGILDYQNSN
jgi:hypothetical protein